ncbi:glycoside hydrolase family protein [Enterococcus casseliflavus]|uniref:glycoside hydrolase family protein n=1 Tax=Enterococcus casseliflavus TaxID=37734 RepID=UPI003D0B724E
MANENMKISQNGRDLIKEFEGLRLTAYQDSVGVWTIGYGHTQGVYSGMTITETQANNLLDQDLQSHASGIFKYITVQLNQNQFDALVSFHFNLGANILQGSTLLSYINSRNWQAAANEMNKYVNAGGQPLEGLIRRRKAESELFLRSSTGTATNLEAVINWFKVREGKVSYSQINRLGPSSYDCSSAVFFALIEGGFLPSGTHIGNTESLYGLEGSLLIPISRSEVRRGDLFVSGIKGGSGGNDGHTGVFLDNTNIIHCTPAGDIPGIITTPATGWMGDYRGLPVYYYRLKQNNQQPNKGETTMQCIYWRPSQTTAGQNNAYYFDGTSSKYLDHPDQIKIIERIYKDNNGKDIPTYHFDGKTPWYTRIEQISGKKPVSGALG